MKKVSSNFAAYISLLTQSVLIGFTFLVVKQCVSLTTPVGTLFFRFWFALIFVLLLAAFKITHLDFKGKKHRAELAAAAFFYCAFLGLQSLGLTFTTSVISGILFACVPIISAIFSAVILKERTNGVQNAFMLISVSGVIAVTLLGNTLSQDFSITGALILLASAVCSALASVFMRKVKSVYSPYEIGFCNSLMGVLLFSAAALISNGFSPNAWGEFFSPLTKLDFIFFMLYLGVGCTFLTSALQGYALKHLSTVRVTIWSNLSSAISLIAGVVILGEPLEVYQIFCSILIIFGVIGVNLFSKYKRGGAK